MSFASIFVPNFRVQAVLRSEPELRERPLALLAGNASIRSVVGVNEVAAKAGVKLGMTKSQAQQFGATEFRPRSVMQEKISHAALLDLGWSVSPRIEDTAADTIVLDLAGLSSLFGADGNIASQLSEGAARLGFKTQIATASNLEAAILASRAFVGITVIPAGQDAAIIGKVPVAALLPSPEIFETFRRWGVQTCAELAALPVVRLSERLGQVGVRLHELARAQSTRAMVLAQPAIDFEEELELEESVGEVEPLAFLVGRLLDQLCARLAARSLAVGAIRARFELDLSSQKQIDRGKGELRRESASGIYEKTLRLPVAMSDAKMLLKLLVLQWQADAPPAPIVKINLAAEAALPRVSQGALFSPLCPDPEKVELTVARLAKLVGAENVGSPELLDTHRPEGFRMRRFSPPPADSRREIRRPSQAQDSATEAKVDDTEVRHLMTAFRVFRPAPRARVEIRKGCPARLAFSGMRGRVVAASGPWRSSGDWWREDAWQSDEWDLEVQIESDVYSRSPAGSEPRQGGPPHIVYRVFYDLARKEWFVRGAYD